MSLSPLFLFFSLFSRTRTSFLSPLAHSRPYIDPGYQMGLAEVLHWPSGGPSQRHDMFGSDGGAGFAFQQRRRRRQRPAPLAETAHHNTYSGPSGPYSPPFTAYAEARGSGRSPGSPPAATVMPTGTSSPSSFAPTNRSKNTVATAVRSATAAFHGDNNSNINNSSPPSSSSPQPQPQPHHHHQQAAFPSSVYRHARRLASSVSSTSSSSSPSSYSSSSHRRRSSRSSAANTTMPEYRHIRSSSLSVPGNDGSPSGRGSNPGAAAAAANSVMPRSPPSMLCFLAASSLSLSLSLAVFLLSFLLSLSLCSAHCSEPCSALLCPLCVCRCALALGGEGRNSPSFWPSRALGLAGRSSREPSARSIMLTICASI